MRRFAFALAAVALLTPRAADAGLYLGLRAGAAFPSGDLAKNEAAVSDAVDVAIPFQGDAGWLLRSGLMLGLYLRAAPAALDKDVQDACEALPGKDSECVAVDFALGLQANWEFAPGEQLQPWLGGFVGWEALAWRASTEGTKTDIAYSGFELGAQGGLDFLLVPPFKIGPYVQVGWGRFTDQTIDPEGSVKFENSIDDRAWHMWTTVGAKLGVQFK